MSAFLSLAALITELVFFITFSSSGEPKIYSNGLARPLRVFAAEYAPVSELSLYLPPSITGSLNVHNKTGQSNFFRTSLI